MMTRYAPASDEADGMDTELMGTSGAGGFGRPRGGGVPDSGFGYRKPGFADPEQSGQGWDDAGDVDDEPGSDGGGQGVSGREVARAAIVAVVGLVLMLPAIGVMPKLGVWMESHGPFAVMLPFMLWMMLAGGLLSSGVGKIITAAKG